MVALPDGRFVQISRTSVLRTAVFAVTNPITAQTALIASELINVALKMLRLAVEKPVVTLERHAAVTMSIAATLATSVVTTPLVDVAPTGRPAPSEATPARLV